ncbi:MAG: hypothetical protein EOP84_30670 [Verrucomicrobiaceae bacterium]|nr:MAG: hypothetical protein EOP84_30670 [Verrucomicrobiaceae bacterium]
MPLNPDALLPSMRGLVPILDQLHEFCAANDIDYSLVFDGETDDESTEHIDPILRLTYGEDQGILLGLTLEQSAWIAEEMVEDARFQRLIEGPRFGRGIN